LGVVEVILVAHETRDHVGVADAQLNTKEHVMNNLIWLIGAVVIVLFILGYFGLGR
jgi:hypothetical protein